MATARATSVFFLSLKKEWSLEKTARKGKTKGKLRENCQKSRKINIVKQHGIYFLGLDN